MDSRLPTDDVRDRFDLGAERASGRAPTTPAGPVEVRVSGNVLFREVDGEAVILELGSGRYFGLDEVGQRIWSMLVGRRSPAEIVDALLAEYDASADRIRADVTAFIDRLSALDLLTVAYAEPAGAVR